jgi:hypothetical protein
MKSYLSNPKLKVTKEMTDHKVSLLQSWQLEIRQRIDDISAVLQKPIKMDKILIEPEMTGLVSCSSWSVGLLGSACPNRARGASIVLEISVSYLLDAM